MKQKVSLVGNKCKCLIQKLKSAVHEENCHQQRWELCSLCAVRWKTCKMHHSATWHYFHPFQVLSAIWNARLCMRHVIVLAELQWVMVMESPQPHWAKLLTLFQACRYITCTVMSENNLQTDLPNIHQIGIFLPEYLTGLMNELSFGGEGGGHSRLLPLDLGEC